MSEDSRVEESRLVKKSGTTNTCEANVNTSLRFLASTSYASSALMGLYALNIFLNRDLSFENVVAGGLLTALSGSVALVTHYSSTSIRNYINRDMPRTYSSLDDPEKGPNLGLPDEDDLERDRLF